MSLPVSGAMMPQRRELLNWFRTHAASLADAYAGALLLLAEPTFPGRIHFIAHAVREIADRLASVLDPQFQNTRVQYENKLDIIEALWPELSAIKEANASLGPQDTVVIVYDLAVKLDYLVKAHRLRRSSPSSYEQLFRFLMRNESFQAAVNERLVSDFKNMRDWFMQYAHFRAEAPTPVDEDILQTRFQGFEGMLHSFVGDFFTGKAGLDDILQQANA